jgi:hypothetical protein
MPCRNSAALPLPPSAFGTFPRKQGRNSAALSEMGNCDLEIDRNLYLFSIQLKSHSIPIA